MTLKRTDELAFAIGMEIKRADDRGQLTGYAAVIGNLDRAGEVIAPGAFAESIAAFPTVPLLWAHKPEAVIGRVTSMVEDDKGLRIEARLNLDVTAGREAHASVKSGDVDSLSIGFRTIRRDGPVLKQIEVLEVSLVAVAANERAKVTAVKSFETRVDFKKALCAGTPFSRSVADKIVEAYWERHGGGAGDEEPSCIFCNKTKGTRFKSLLRLDGIHICGDHAVMFGEVAHEMEIDTDVVAKRLAAALTEIKSLKLEGPRR